MHGDRHTHIRSPARSRTHSTERVRAAVRITRTRFAYISNRIGIAAHTHTSGGGGGSSSLATLQPWGTLAKVVSHKYTRARIDTALCDVICLAITGSAVCPSQHDHRRPNAYESTRRHLSVSVDHMRALCCCPTADTCRAVRTNYDTQCIHNLCVRNKSQHSK